MCSQHTGTFSMPREVTFLSKLGAQRVGVKCSEDSLRCCFYLIHQHPRYNPQEKLGKSEYDREKNSSTGSTQLVIIFVNGNSHSQTQDRECKTLSSRHHYISSVQKLAVKEVKKKDRPEKSEANGSAVTH